MDKNILTISNLYVNAGDKEILAGVDLEVGYGQTHVLMGPNGTGKSTLGLALMGSPKYEITKGNIVFAGEDITEEGANERAKKGIFLSFQNPPEVPGVTLSSFIKSALELSFNYENINFSSWKKYIETHKKELSIKLNEIISKCQENKLEVSLNKRFKPL